MDSEQQNFEKTNKTASKWSDQRKWTMGIAATLFVSALTAFTSYSWSLLQNSNDLMEVSVADNARNINDSISVTGDCNATNMGNGIVSVDCRSTENFSELAVDRINLNSLGGGSSGAKEAIEALNMAGESLGGVDVSCERFGKQSGRDIGRTRGGCDGAVLLEELDAEGAELNEANFSGSYLLRANFHKSSMTRTNFEYSQAYKANFEGVSASMSSFLGAELKETNFSSARLTGANILMQTWRVQILKASS